MKVDDKSFEARFEASWNEQTKREEKKRKIFWKSIILSFIALFPFSLILGFVFIL